MKMPSRLGSENPSGVLPAIRLIAWAIKNPGALSTAIPMEYFITQLPADSEVAWYKVGCHLVLINQQVNP
jgi:hypothetical protein